MNDTTRAAGAVRVARIPPNAWHAYRRLLGYVRPHRGAFLLGMLALPIGLLLVLLHNYWNAGVLALLVTIFGWIILLKSILVFVVSPEQMGRLVRAVKMESWWYVYVVIVLLIGAYLTYAGFMTAA